jgi:hypothetical protein
MRGLIVACLACPPSFYMHMVTVTAGCPLDLPALIHRCWADPAQRPTFKVIVEELQVERDA